MSESAPLADRLAAHVRMLSETIGDRSMARHAQLERAAEYITGRLRAAGYDVDAQSYTLDGKRATNLVAELRGATAPEEVVIVGAHYDSCFNPGADDNASGVAGLLELAAALRGERPHRTIRFIAFTNEEPPYFQSDVMGSVQYVKRLGEARRQVRAVVVLEMIGYYSDAPRAQHYPLLMGFGRPSAGNFLGIVGNWRSRALVRRIDAAWRRHSRLPVESIATWEAVPGVGWSDHWAFWEHKLPAVMLTDTAFLRNPHYHQASDQWTTLDYPRMAQAVEGVRHVLLELVHE